MEYTKAVELAKAINSVDDHTAARILARVMGTYLSDIHTPERDRFFQNLQEEYNDLINK
ncbi:hypothetical protein FHR92_003004 [Fontibacillus solani]|uniref:Uncharacterized protein n=1 Tax=Fontibacillus solani TaxID=1572857 RepID=A0A7W3XSG4_9BACL|nr:hypothetical protein [Fontibacillus solani]MBA9086526.1 hypothetical protein [Fontibacillus solani]